VPALFCFTLPPPYIHTKPSLLVCSYSSIFIHAMRSILDVRHSEKKSETTRRISRISHYFVVWKVERGAHGV
jgi:hypothetical protein